MDTLIIVAVGLVLFALLAWPFYRKIKKMERDSREADQKAERYGLKEPVSLHPVVDPDICIGSAGCIAVCPEEDVLGLRNGRAVAVSPANCVGHGLCERACPVDAIQLVIGTEKRGVDLPRLTGEFETNRPGIYVVGELGGMGLIRNAFEQGKQCVASIIRQIKKEPTAQEDLLDLVIVGCGPAGLSASIYAQDHGLKYITLEREDIGGTVRHYPRKKLVMTQPLRIPGHGKIHHNEISKEELMALWKEIVGDKKLNLKTQCPVKHIQPLDRTPGYRVDCEDNHYNARRVILAIGRRGTPRKLDIPGEELENVMYMMREPEQFQHQKVTVVGGGDSAVEAALALADQPGNTVRISYRRSHFSRIKPDNHRRIEEAMDKGEIRVLWESNVIENRPDAIDLSFADGSTKTLENDFLFIFAGGVLPTGFLQQVGIDIDTKFGEPVNSR